MPTSFFADFNPIAELVLGYRAAKPLLVALHYELFTRVEEGLDTVSRLARRLRLDPGALERVLDAIAALGYLRKSGSRYRNTRPGRRLLVAGSPEYIGSNLRYQEQTWDAWSELRTVLKTGRPRLDLLDWIRKDCFTMDYIKAMGDVSRVQADDLAARLDWRGVRRSLDVGCGAGTFSAAFTLAAPGLEAVLLDLPKTLPIARGLLRSHSGYPRMRFRRANYLTDELGEEEFDLILLSNVTRVEDEKTNRGLVRKARRALRPGGRLVIHDFVIDESRAAPRFSALLNVHLLLFTGKGRVYTAGEYASWLREAGFAGLRRVPVARGSLHPSLALLGRK